MIYKTTLVLTLLFCLAGPGMASAKDFRDKATRDERARFPESFDNEGQDPPEAPNDETPNGGTGGPTTDPEPTPDGDQPVDSVIPELDARNFNDAYSEYEDNFDDMWNEALESKRDGNMEEFEERLDELRDIQEEFEEMSDLIDSQGEVVTEGLGDDLSDGDQFEQDLDAATTDAERDRIIDRARDGHYGPVGDELRRSIDKLKEIREAKKKVKAAIDHIEGGIQLLEDTSPAPRDRYGMTVPQREDAYANAPTPTLANLTAMRQSIAAKPRREVQTPYLIHDDPAADSARRAQQLLVGLDRFTSERRRNRERRDDVGRFDRGSEGALTGMLEPALEREDPASRTREDALEVPVEVPRDFFAERPRVFESQR